MAEISESHKGQRETYGESWGDDLPQVRGLELVGLGKRRDGRLQEVTLGSRGTLGLGVAVLDTSHLEHTLASRGSNDTSSSRGRDKSAHDGTRLSTDLARDGVRLGNVGTPVSSSDGDNGELGDDDGTSDGGSDFLGALDTESDVSVKVSDGDERLESGSLTGGSLLLDRGDGHDLVLKGWEEDVDDLVLLDREGEKVDLLHGLDLAVLHETSEFGNWDPWVRRCRARCLARNSPLLLLVLLSTSSGSSSSTGSATATAESASSSSSTFSHFVDRCKGVLGRRLGVDFA